MKAPPQLWYEALRVAFDIPEHVSNMWEWATEYSYQAIEFPPLGSRHLGENWYVRQQLTQDLSSAVSRASLGQCLGRDFVMRLGEDAFTPDVMFIRVLG